MTDIRHQWLPARLHSPNTRGWGRSRRPSVTPLDEVTATNGAIGVLGVRLPENQRLEESEPLLGRLAGSRTTPVTVEPKLERAIHRSRACCGNRATRLLI